LILFVIHGILSSINASIYYSLSHPSSFYWLNSFWDLIVFLNLCFVPFSNCSFLYSYYSIHSFDLGLHETAYYYYIDFGSQGAITTIHSLIDAGEQRGD